jgi:hypothetical protein
VRSDHRTGPRTPHHRGAGRRARGGERVIPVLADMTTDNYIALAVSVAVLVLLVLVLINPEKF